MIRNLKALGLAVVAVFAMSAMAAQAASAQDLFTSPIEKTIVTGETEQAVAHHFVSQAGGAKVECKHGTFTGTVLNKAASVTVHPVYTECQAVGIGAATVNTHGCDYVLTGDTEGGSTEGLGTDATVELECTAGSAITVAVPGVCTLTFGNQKVSGVHYDNIAGSPNHVTVTVTVKKVHYTKAGAFCGLVPCKLEGGTCVNGELTESVTVKGYEGTHSVDPVTHTWTVNEVKQVGLTVS